MGTWVLSLFRQGQPAKHNPTARPLYHLKRWGRPQGVKTCPGGFKWCLGCKKRTMTTLIFYDKKFPNPWGRHGPTCIEQAVALWGSAILRRKLGRPLHIQSKIPEKGFAPCHSCITMEVLPYVRHLVKTHWWALYVWPLMEGLMTISVGNCHPTLLRRRESTRTPGTAKETEKARRTHRRQATEKPF